MGKKVLFADGHGEAVRVKQSVINSLIKKVGAKLDPFETLQKYLLHFGYSIQFSENRSLSLQLLRKYDILVVYNPTSPLSPQEINAIEKFVQLEGSLLLIGQCTIPILPLMSAEGPLAISNLTNAVSGMMSGTSKFYEYINNISRKFGIFFISDILQGGHNSYTLTRPYSTQNGSPSRRRYNTSTKNGSQSFNVPLISQFEPHPIFQKIKQFYYYGCCLEVTQGASPLAYSDADTKPSKTIVMAVSQTSGGRVFATGSPLIFTQSRIADLSIRYKEHAQLALN
ncbi:MAG: hypothetical protein LUQ65_13265, partial [Candidatus Helarchaeota archaeon]|nr:hypothetical protein [Candidatus Helarchaeota archaeon]